FGVQHKELVKQLRANVDVLTLTATPIPRTLEMSLTGIRDLSLVNTPPEDRQPILTYVGEFDERAAAEAIRRELLREGQVFFVHNRVQDIDYVSEQLRELVPEARIGVAHGQMDEGRLERVVLDFWEREYDVLVCTTIVESGLDIPTVNTLVVDRSDLLGLAQLYQLRGRVGRRGQRAYAYLLHPRDRALTDEAYERRKTIGEFTGLGSEFKTAPRDREARRRRPRRPRSPSPACAPNACARACAACRCSGGSPGSRASSCETRRRSGCAGSFRARWPRPTARSRFRSGATGRPCARRSSS